ncbi:hypothetical protein [Metabacillus halosaccharovorans]|uniref:hypothetical protein n=1 Tax=Metabacillus halosaccharovorans TaxID=930124 RepID=UPI001C2000A4|nr:hypothetical protein [Metabacillus halosaccharovorans]MBU7595700.1 hypothetical protein [Metabacillus halosaccharovorans]
MKRKIRILCGAEPFAYGPCSKLVTVINYIVKKYDCEIFFRGEGSSLQYALENMPKCTEIKKSSNLDFLKDSKKGNGYDFIISVMDWKVTTYGYLNNIPIIFIDSLFWVWQWSRQDVQEVDQMLAVFKEDKNYNHLIEFLKGLPNHMQIYASHQMSTYSILQQYPGASNRKEILNSKVIPVGPIIEERNIKSLERNKILISFSGTKNPLVNKENIITYLTFVKKLLEPIINSKNNIIWTINSEYLDLAQTILPGNVRSLTHVEFLNMLNESIVLIAPVGITTLYEAAKYETPLIFLPEQHDGHIKNYNRLMKLNEIEYMKKIFPETLINNHFKLKSPKDPLENVKEIYDIYNKMLSGQLTEEYHSLQINICQSIKLILNANSMIHNKQSKLITSYLKKFDTFEQVIEKIIAN